MIPFPEHICALFVNKGVLVRVEMLRNTFVKIRIEIAAAGD